MEKLKKWYGRNREVVVLCGGMVSSFVMLGLTLKYMPESSWVKESNRLEHERKMAEYEAREAMWDREMAHYAECGVHDA